MRPTCSYAFAVILALCCAITSLNAQSQATEKKRLLGTVAGKVSIKGKGATGIVVGLRQADTSNPFAATNKATTDQDGNYRIFDVLPGNYEVMPAAPAFVVSDGNRTVVMGEGERVEDLNFSLVRGGVITGKITDADGRALIQQQVSLLRIEPTEQRNPRPYVVNSSTTDDRGIYRMFGIAPGRYRVAGGQGDISFPRNTMVGRPYYKQVFYPDVSDPAKATIIEVSPGSEATNVDITLGRAEQTFAASGRVVDGEKGLPVPNVRFVLQRIAGDRFDFVSTFATSNSQGDFSIDGLAPGKYGVTLLPEPNIELRADMVAFDVVDEDVSGLVVKVVKGASLSGIVVLESEDQKAIAKLGQLQIQAYVPNQGMGGTFGHSGRIGPDGSFRVGGLQAGTANVTLGVMDGNQLKGFTISHVERDGVVLPQGVEVKDSEQVTGLRIFVSYGNATLRGVVKLENGTLPANGQIIIRLGRPGEMSSNIQSLRVDARGHFLIEGLQPGLYGLSVYVSPGVRSRPPVKQQVSVQEGVITDVTITFDLGMNPGSNSP